MLRGLFFKSRLIRRVIVLCGLLLAPGLWGCGMQKQPWEKVYPAKGVVIYKGNPVADAEISLFPEDSSFPDSIRPRAKTTENGEFVVWTNQPGDGAPAGIYKAVVVHHEIVSSEHSMASNPNDLPAKYSRRDTTDLYVQIDEKETEIPPLELE